VTERAFFWQGNTIKLQKSPWGTFPACLLCVQKFVQVILNVNCSDLHCIDMPVVIVEENVKILKQLEYYFGNCPSTFFSFPTSPPPPPQGI